MFACVVFVMSYVCMCCVRDVRMFACVVFMMCCVRDVRMFACVVFVMCVCLHVLCS